MLILQIFEIIGLVYQYIKLLRQVSPQEWIFRELQDIGNMSFRFMQDQAQDDYAVQLGGAYCIWKCMSFSHVRKYYRSYDMVSYLNLYHANSQNFCLAGNLLRYSAEHVIYGDYVYETWDEDLIKYVLGFFRPENMRIDVISKSSFKSEGKTLLCKKTKEGCFLSSYWS